MAQTVQAKALFDCVGDEESELTFNEGDIITDVKGSSEDGWLHGRLLRTGEEGLFPDNYVEIIPVEAPAAKQSAPPQLPARPLASPSPPVATTAASSMALKPQLPMRNNRLSSPTGTRDMGTTSSAAVSKYSAGINTQSMYGSPSSTSIQKPFVADSSRALSGPPALPKRVNSFVEKSDDTTNAPELSVKERMANLSQTVQRQANMPSISNSQSAALPSRSNTKEPSKVISSPLFPSSRPVLPPRDGSSKSLTSTTSASNEEPIKHVHHIEDATVPVPKLTTFARPRSARTGKSSGSPLQTSSSSIPSRESTPPKLPSRTSSPASVAIEKSGDTRSLSPSATPSTKISDASSLGPVRFSPAVLKQGAANISTGLPTVSRNAQPLPLPSRNASNSPTPSSAPLSKVPQVTLKPTTPVTSRFGTEQNGLSIGADTPIASPFGVKLNSIGSGLLENTEASNNIAPPLPARSSTIPLTASTPTPEGPTTPSTRLQRNASTRPFSPSTPGSLKSEWDIEAEKLKNAGMLSFSPSKGVSGTRVAMPPPKMPEVATSVPVRIKPDARRRYETLFKSVTAGEYINGPDVHAVYVRSRLDSKTLAQIWEMVDVDNAGRLSRAQFCMGLYLIDERLGSGLIPLEVSDELWVSVMQ